MANIELLKIDRDKELQGIWVDYVLGIKLRIARARNSKYLEEIMILTEPYKKELRESEDVEKFEKILKQVRAKTILLDWQNIEDKDGNVIPYSVEKALEFFNNPELRDFYNFVILTSEDADYYRKNLIKDSEKN